MAEPLLPEDPARLGSYELTGRLGDGAQGVVYLGSGPGGAQVAVKLLHAQLSGNPTARSRFVRELEVAERVAGFCTAQVLDADIAGDRPYIVSEYVPGPSLSEQVESAGPFGPEALVRLAMGTVTALAAIHRVGIVHRDFKPPNVLMGRDGPRVIDFGIARALDSSSITLTSQIVGTPAFMAPEQVAGGAVGPYTDMFGWAGTMVYAATGRPPFGSDSIPAVMNRILHAEPDLSMLPPALAGLVGACLAKDPARRPSAPDVLLQLLGQVGAARPSHGGDMLAQAASLVTSEFPVSPAPPPYVVQQQSWGTAPGPPPVPGVGPGPRRGLKAPLLIAGAAVMAVVLVVAGFLLVSREKSGPTAGDGPASVKLAFMGALSGQSEAVGRPIFNGARLAVQEYNATEPRVRVEMVEVDTEGEPAQATSQTRRIIDGGFAGVIGPGFSAEARNAAPVLGREGVPMVSPAASDASLSSSGGPYWHRVVPGNDKSVQALADFMVRAAAVKRVAVLEDENAWTTPDAQAVGTALAAKRVTITRLRIQSSANDYSADLAKISKAGAGAVFYGGYYDPAARLIKQARAKGLKARFFLTDQSLAAGFVELAGREQAQGTVISCSCFDPSGSTLAPVSSFRARYAKANGGQNPGLYTGEGYDAATAFIEAVKAGRTTREEINGFLRTISVPGVTRRIGFTSAGDPSDDTSYVYVVNNGRIAMAGPARTATLP